MEKRQKEKEAYASSLWSLIEGIPCPAPQSQLYRVEIACTVWAAFGSGTFFTTLIR